MLFVGTVPQTDPTDPHEFPRGSRGLRLLALGLLSLTALAGSLTEGDKYDLLVVAKEQAYSQSFNQWCELKRYLATGPKRSPVEKEAWDRAERAHDDLLRAVDSHE